MPLRCCLLCGIWLICCAGQLAEARPNYSREFWNAYGVPLAAHKKNCLACHAGEEKQVRNHYGIALQKKLEAKNVNIPARIKAALDAVEQEPSAIEGKTFGDLIKDGKLPASKP